MDPNPPPPYSETDIYSNTSSHPILTPATSQADDISVTDHPQLSTASSVDGTIIYTPLHSPTGSDHQESLQDGLGHISTSSAAAYFESRPILGQTPTQLITHNIKVGIQTQPEELCQCSQTGFETRAAESKAGAMFCLSRHASFAGCRL